jgi:hypothetical protein
MSIKINGATVSQRGYEFGVRYDGPRGIEKTDKVENAEEARDAADFLNGTAVFLAVYETGWMEML